MLLAAVPAFASVPLACSGSATLGTFRLLVRPFSHGEPLPLKSVADIAPGSRLIWNPVHLMPPAAAKGEVAVVIVPASNAHLIVMEPRKASVSTEWQILERPQVIAVFFGPQGLSEGKIQSLIHHDAELLKELADYAEQSSQVEALVQELADAEESGASTNAVLKGFTAQYGVATPRLDMKASSDQQAQVLLGALMPASTAYDPLAGRGAVSQQSGGLAASVAALFFGDPVALAVGGAALAANLRTALFPDTDFRSAFTEEAPPDELSLCSKSAAPKAKMRSAYLWAYRVPDRRKPAVSFAGMQHLPLGSKSTVGIKIAGPSTAKDLSLARAWELTPVSGGAPVPVTVQALANDSLDLDLTKIHAAPGEYRLSATWDWTPLAVTGTLHLHSYGDFAHVTLAPGEHDKLVEGSGALSLKLTGTDFEFLEKAAIESSAPKAKPSPEDFSLPVGKRRGPQTWAKLDFEPVKMGSYRLLLTQSDGVEHEVPITVLPPNPKISNGPVRLNAGETRETIRFKGSGLDRIEAVSSKAGEISGAPDADGWSGNIALKPGVIAGQKFAVVLKIQGLEDPLTVPDAIQIVGPRPRIESIRKSLPGDLGVDIGADELPAGASVGLVLNAGHMHHNGNPRVELNCETGELRQALTLAPGETSGGASLTFAGPETMYLSFDPGLVGYAGCNLAASILEDPEGRSDAFALGRVIRIPHLDRFTLTTEKVGDSEYAGLLEGSNLDVIDKTGWEAEHGEPVMSIPTPVASDPTRQTLRVVLPWPAPAPHAPLYVWLRGEEQGRKTAVAY